MEGERQARDGTVAGTEGFEASILGSMTSGIVAIDGAGAVVTFNRGAQRILGCPAGDVAHALGRDCREVLASQPAVARLLLEALERQNPLSRAELQVRSAGGARAASIGFTLTPVFDAAGRRRGVAMLFRDLAPIERGDEQERLRQRLAALGQVAAGLAHEIRNPLAGMEVLAGLLKRRLADRPEEQALVAELIGELRALADTVSASLEFVRPLSPLRKPVDAVALVEEALTLARARVPFDGVVERDFAAAAPLWADADLLRTVLTNLIANALESMMGAEAARSRRLRLEVRERDAERGRRAVRVGADGTAEFEERPRTEVEIAVGDTGPGVAPELREKIFYPFFTTREKGSGVGLAAAQKIVAGHDGSLELETPPGGGCVFRVRLPAEPVEAE
jgi:PAS domain S-box-containing protein